MNRYLEDGLLGDAMQGKRVILIDSNRNELRTTFAALAERGDSLVSVRRVNGSERIEFMGGGTIHFIRPTSTSVRGISADVVVVRGWNELSESQRQDIVPMVLSRQGELIRT